MILSGEKFKSCIQKTKTKVPGNSSPHIVWKFDNGQDFYGKNASKPCFSWRVTGNLKLPILPILVGAALTACAIASMDLGKDKK